MDRGLPTVCNVRVDFSATDCVSRGFISDLYQIWYKRRNHARSLARSRPLYRVSQSAASSGSRTAHSSEVMAYRTWSSQTPSISKNRSAIPS